MKSIFQLLALLFVSLFALGLAGMLLAKLRLLPVILYRMIVETIFPLWIVEERTTHLAITAVLLLYAVLYWAFKALRWWQEERALRGHLLATATPFYSTELIE